MPLAQALKTVSLSGRYGAHRSGAAGYQPPRREPAARSSVRRALQAEQRAKLLPAARADAARAALTTSTPTPTTTTMCRNWSTRTPAPTLSPCRIWTRSRTPRSLTTTTPGRAQLPALQYSLGRHRQSPGPRRRTTSCEGARARARARGRTPSARGEPALTQRLRRAAWLPRWACSSTGMQSPKSLTSRTRRGPCAPASRRVELVSSCASAVAMRANARALAVPRQVQLPSQERRGFLDARGACGDGAAPRTAASSGASSDGAATGCKVDPALGAATRCAQRRRDAHTLRVRGEEVRLAPLVASSVRRTARVIPPPRSFPAHVASIPRRAAA